MSQLINIARGAGEVRTNAIFLHGLGGGPRSTWQSGSDDRSFWPRWLAEDIEGLAIYMVGYEAPISRWRGTAMHLTDRATNVLARLLAEPQLRQGKVILIGHSLGGLVIKQLLRTADIEARQRDDVADLIARIEKIAFLATPHTGSDLANWGDRLRILVRPAAAATCLMRNDPNLRDLNQWYRGWAAAQNIFHLVLTETEPTRILGMIMKPDSSDPGIARSRPVPISANHSTICKPTGRTSDTYVQVKAFIERRIEWPKGPRERQPERKPIALPYPSLGSLFKGRDQFLKELRASLSRGMGRTAIVGTALYGLGGIGKTRAAVEYAWAHQGNYSALLFVIAETPEALRRNLAALVGPLVLNLPEQSAIEEEMRPRLAQPASRLVSHSGQSRHAGGC
jgi:pimeloyl-ACP methyl ester carboxylesterase